MSAESWLEAFYPVTARKYLLRPRKRSEIAWHSLRKWRGLTKRSLERHGVFVPVDGPTFVCEDAGVPVEVARINGSSCTLCIEAGLGSPVARKICDSCELRWQLGRACSDLNGPWQSWLYARNPVPMIRALAATVRRLKMDEESNPV